MFGIAEEAVAVGVHFEHAAAGFDRSGLAGVLQLAVVAGHGVPVLVRTILVPARPPAIAAPGATRLSTTRPAATFPFSHMAPNRSVTQARTRP